MGQRAAFFDLDRTLIPGSSLFLLARGAYDRDFYRVRDLLRFGWQQALFRLGGESEEGIDTSRRAALEFVAGRSTEELRAMGQEIVEERILPRVYEGITKVVERHKAAGDLTYLCTASPPELAEIVAESLEMTGALGTTAEIAEDGTYTGELSDHGILHGEAKAGAVAELAQRVEIDLDESYAYSDSINDLPLLELVGQPRAVNPDAELTKIAKERSWPVLDLRPRRQLLLVGIPSAILAAGLFGAGVAVGGWFGRRAAYREMKSVWQRSLPWR